MLDESESRHLTQVLRAQPNDEILVFDDSGSEWKALVSQVNSSMNVQVCLTEPVRRRLARQYRLLIAQAIPQRGKMDFISEKAGELGVDVLIPMVTERTIVKMTSEQETKVIARWQKIAREAVKQSHSQNVTEISDFETLDSILKQSNNRLVVMLDPSANNTFEEFTDRLKELILRKQFNELLIVIGPEGGFSKRELEMAHQEKVNLISLGDNILKTDTAFVAIASAIKMRFS